MCIWVLYSTRAPVHFTLNTCMQSEQWMSVYTLYCVCIVCTHIFYVHALKCNCNLHLLNVVHFHIVIVKKCNKKKLYFRFNVCCTYTQMCVVYGWFSVNTWAVFSLVIVCSKVTNQTKRKCTCKEALLTFFSSYIFANSFHVFTNLIVLRTLKFLYISVLWHWVI